MRLLTAVSGVRVPQQAPDKHSEMSAFLLCCIGNRTPTPLVYGDAIDTAEPHWAFSLCVQAHPLHYLSGVEASIGVIQITPTIVFCYFGALQTAS